MFLPFLLLNPGGTHHDRRLQALISQTLHESPHIATTGFPLLCQSILVLAVPSEEKLLQDQLRNHLLLSLLFWLQPGGKHLPECLQLLLCQGVIAILWKVELSTW